MTIEPGKNSPTRQVTDAMGVEIDGAFKARLKPNVTHASMLEIASEKIGDKTFKDAAEAASGLLRQVELKKDGLRRDPTMTGAAKMLRLEEYTRQNRQRADALLNQAARSALQTLQEARESLFSNRAQPNPSDAALLPLYARQLSEGKLQPHRLTGSTEGEATIVLALAREYPSLLPEDAPTYEELAKMADQAFSPEALEKLAAAEEAYKAAEQLARHVEGELAKALPPSLLGEIRRRKS